MFPNILAVSYKNPPNTSPHFPNLSNGRNIVGECQRKSIIDGNYWKLMENVNLLEKCWTLITVKRYKKFVMFFTQNVHGKDDK